MAGEPAKSQLVNVARWEPAKSPWRNRCARVRHRGLYAGRPMPPAAALGWSTALLFEGSLRALWPPVHGRAPPPPPPPRRYRPRCRRTPRPGLGSRRVD